MEHLTRVNIYNEDSYPLLNFFFLFERLKLVKIGHTHTCRDSGSIRIAWRDK